MSTYFFQLGNTPELSLLELETLTQAKPVAITRSLYQLDTDVALDLDAIQLASGGLVKSMELVQFLTITDADQDELENTITKYLDQPQPKITFSVSVLSQELPFSLDLSTIKKNLKKSGHSVRYLDSTRSGLTAAVLTHQDVIELNLIKLADQWALAKTMSVQDIDDWTKRDRAKPYADSVKGMLPPKVARMMVNIGLGLINTSSDTPLVYDPFCGSGTILMEALMRDCQVLGSDIDQAAVSGAEQNTQWLKTAYGLSQPVKIIHHDATQPLKESPLVDAIITEPFLGKPKPSPSELKNIFKGLYKLYLGAFKNWTNILKPGAAVVIILPLVETLHGQYNLNKLIDKLPQLGYTTHLEAVTYARPNATVKRQLHFLRFKGNQDGTR